MPASSELARAPSPLPALRPFLMPVPVSLTLCDAQSYACLGFARMPACGSADLLGGPAVGPSRPWETRGSPADFLGRPPEAWLTPFLIPVLACCLPFLWRS